MAGAAQGACHCQRRERRPDSDTATQRQSWTLYPLSLATWCWPARGLWSRGPSLITDVSCALRSISRHWLSALRVLGSVPGPLRGLLVA